MKFEINNRHWEIVEKSKEELEKLFPNEDDGEIFGLCDHQTQTIYLWKDLHPEQKIRTLIHELTHCYIGCYMSFEDMLWEEDVICNLVANSHYIIHDIVDKYFKSVEK